MSIVMFDLCLSSFKPVHKNHKAIYCDICCKWVHLSCTALNKFDYNFLAATDENYFCSKCISDILPFNYIVDQREYLNVILIFFLNFPIFCNFVSNKQQLHILNNKTVLKNDDIDPDKNIYNLF